MASTNRFEMDGFVDLPHQCNIKTAAVSMHICKYLIQA